MSRNELLNKFLNDDFDINARILAGKAVLESFDDLIEDDQENVIKSIVESILVYLNKGSVEHIQENPVHQIRKLCLEILHKVPPADSMKSCAQSILSLAFKLLECENEENSIHCTKIILEIHKNFRQSVLVITDLNKFLTFVKRVYKEYQSQIDKIFISPPSYKCSRLESFDLNTNILDIFCTTKIETDELNSNGSKKIYHLIPKACFSLKLMQEIPLLVVFMHQLFKSHIQKEMSDFIPLLLEFINLKPSNEVKAHPRYSNEMTLEFLAAQTKTLSFIAYAIKGSLDSIDKYITNLVDGMKNLLVSCPPNVTNIRKEFFVAARHILNHAEIRPKFLSVLDRFMDEKILIGSGNVVKDALRPLVYSTLADLVHHIRTDLSLNTISTAIDLYGRNMFDTSLPFSIRQMSLKLLLNIIDCIRQKAQFIQCQLKSQVAVSNLPMLKISAEFVNELLDGTARTLLTHALAIFVRKCRMVITCYLPIIESNCENDAPTILKNLLGKPNFANDFLPAQLSSFSDGPNLQYLTKTQKSLFAAGSIGILGGAPIPTDSHLKKDQTDASFTPMVFDTLSGDSFGQPQNQQPLTYVDIRSLIKSLITGIRTAVTCIIQCPHSSFIKFPEITTEEESVEQPKPLSKLKQLTQEETQLLSEYLVLSFRMIDIFQIVLRDGCLYHKNPQSFWKHPDEKLMFDHLAATFVQLNTVSFREIFGTRMHDLVECCIKTPSFTTFVSILTTNTVQTSNFSQILLGYLVDRLDLIGDCSDRSLVYIKLFKIAFNTVNIQRTENEFVIKQYLRRIVQGSMQLCLTDRDPTAYLSLLRTLFRSIGGGSHDKLYREFFPFLPEMLTTLNRLLRSPHRSMARDLLSELCVIVPVRLSTLMPHLNLLMEPLVYVLNCNTANQGLRTLELCVDNLPQDFLYQHLHCLKEDFIQVLYNFFYSPSDHYQKTAFKVLGKLGRFNRMDLAEMMKLRLDHLKGESGPKFTVYLREPEKEISLPLNVSIRCFTYASLEVLQDPTADVVTKKHAWGMLKSASITLFKARCSELNPHAGNDSFLTISDFIRAENFRTGLREQLENPTESSQSCCEIDDINRIISLQTFAGLFILTSEEMQKIDTEGFLNQSLSWCSNLCLVEFLQKKTSGSNISHILLDALLYVIGHEDKSYTLFALKSLKTILMDQIDTLKELLPEMENLQEHICRMPIYKHLASSLIAMLHNNSWFVKWGAFIVLKFIRKFTSDKWFSHHFHDLFWAILNAMHELTSQMSQGSLDLSKEFSEMLVSIVVLSVKGDELEKVLIDIVSGMNSFVNTPEVRKQCRHLIRLALHQMDRSPLSVITTEMIQASRLAELLIYTDEPLHQVQILPDSPRLKKLPLMTQHAILEAYYFLFGHSEEFDPKIAPKRDLDLPIGPIFILDDSRDQDRNFLTDLQDILKDPDFGKVIHLPGMQNNLNSQQLGKKAATGASQAAFPVTSTKIDVTFLGTMQLCEVTCRILATTDYLVNSIEENFLAMFNAIWLSAEPKFHQIAFECLVKFVKKADLDSFHVKTCIRPMLKLLKSKSTKFSQIDMQKIFWTIKLFPEHFSNKFAGLIMEKFKISLENLNTETYQMLNIDPPTFLRVHPMQNTGATGSLQNPVLLAAIESCSEYLDSACEILNIFSLLPLSTFYSSNEEIALSHNVSNFISDIVRPLVELTHGPNGAPFGMGDRWVGQKLLDSLVKFLDRFPSETCELFFTLDIANEVNSIIPLHGLFLEIFEHDGASNIRKYIADDFNESLSKMIELLHKPQSTESSQTIKDDQEVSQMASYVSSAHLAVFIACSEKLSTNLEKCKRLFQAVRDYWKSDEFMNWHGNLMRSQNQPQNHLPKFYRFYLWDQPKSVLNALLSYTKNVKNEKLAMDLVFDLVAGITRFRSILDLSPVKEYIKYLASTKPLSWHRNIFLYFIDYMNKPLHPKSGFKSIESGESLAKLLSHLVLPVSHWALTNEHINKQDFLGPLPSDLSADPKQNPDLVWLFIKKIISHPSIKTCSSLRVMYYQLASIFVEFAPSYIHNNCSSSITSRLNTLMNFVSPCVDTSLHLVDLQEKYLGLYLVVQMMKEFDVFTDYNTMQQVFLILTKGANYIDIRKVLIDLLIQCWIIKSPNNVDSLRDPLLLADSIKKLNMEETGVPTCFQILSLIVRHENICFSIRNHLMPIIFNILTKLASQQLIIDQRRLLIDVIEMVVKWNERSKITQDHIDYIVLDKSQRESLINWMIRYSCQVIDSNPSSSNGLSESVAKKVLSQLDYVLKPETWRGTCGSLTGAVDLKLSFIERFLIVEDSSTPTQTATSTSSNQTASTSASGQNTNANLQTQKQATNSAVTSNMLKTDQSGGVLMTLEVLKDQNVVLHNMRYFSKALSQLMIREFSNLRVMRCIASLLCVVLHKFPAEISSRQKLTSFTEIAELYNSMLKSMHDAFQQYTESSAKTHALFRLQSAFLLLSITQQVPTNPHAFVDRCIVQLIKLTHRLIHEDTTTKRNAAVGLPMSPSSQTSSSALSILAAASLADLESTIMITSSVDLLIISLEILKCRLNIMTHDMRKNAFGPDLCCIIKDSREPKLMRAVIRIIRDWVNVAKSEEHFVPAVKEKVALFEQLWLAYPRWSDNYEVSRDIVSCIQYVFSTASLRNQDLLISLEQAFCCSLLSPLPDLRGQFLKHFLEGSSILISSQNFSNPNESSNSKDAQMSHGPDLLVRLLFLMFNNNWDEAHFKDTFWLPIFIDVLLCQIDSCKPLEFFTSNSTAQVSEDALLEEIIISGKEVHLDDQKTKKDEELEDLKLLDLYVQKSERKSDPKTSSESLSELDIVSSAAQKLEKDGKELLRTSEMENFGDKQPPKFSRIMKEFALKFNQPSAHDFILGISTLCHRRPGLSSHYFIQLWSQLWTCLIAPKLIVPSKCTENKTQNTITHTTSDTLTPFEAHELLVKQITRFLLADEHVNSNDQLFTVTGSMIQAFLTTPKTLAGYFSAPLLTYIAQNFSQWHNIALFLERQAYCSPSNAFGTTENEDSHTNLVIKQENSLGLINIYELIGDIDHFASVWWYRYNSAKAKSDFKAPIDYQERFLSTTLSQNPMLGFVKALQLNQPMKALDWAMLFTAQPIAQVTTITKRRALQSKLFIKQENKEVPEQLVSEESDLKEITTEALININSVIDRSRLRTYCINVMKNLGQWDRLELLSHNTPSVQQQTTSVELKSQHSDLTNGLNLNFVQAEIAWHKKDWSSLFISLANLANEVAPHEHWRLTTIQALASMVGRRSPAYHDYIEPQGFQNPSNSSTIMNALLQSSETEFVRVIQSIVKQWRRFPFIISDMHIPLLQGCHMAQEILEGNNLLAYYCGPVLALPRNSVSGSHVASGMPGGSTLPQGNFSRPPAAQAVDYKNIFKAWQSRLPSIQDNLEFWNDLLVWRQIVVENIIACNPQATRAQDRANLIQACQKELAHYQLMTAKVARKFHFEALASSHLRRYDSTGLPVIFDKIQQEVKLRLAEGQKEDLLDGLELLERTDIQSFDKRERAYFFCYKAVFFSHFNRGDEATKNFGYATQMQDSLHKVWSVYGDFLENVYSSYPAAKREMASHTTGVFAMQALMEAVSVVGTYERKCRGDFAKCLWLLGLDDGEFAVPSNRKRITKSSSGSSANSTPPPRGQQRLAKVFEERLVRVRPEILLSWLQSLCIGLLRPEGRCIAPALKAVVKNYPSALYHILICMQNELSNDVLREIKILHENGDIQGINQLIAFFKAIEEEEPIDFENSDLSEATEPLSPSGDSCTKRKALISPKAFSFSSVIRKAASKKHVVVVMRGSDAGKRKRQTSLVAEDEDIEEEIPDKSEEEEDSDIQDESDIKIKERKEGASSDEDYFLNRSPLTMKSKSAKNSETVLKKKERPTKRKNSVSGVLNVKKIPVSSRLTRTGSKRSTSGDPKSDLEDEIIENSQVIEKIGLSTCYALHRCYSLIVQLRTIHFAKLYVYDRFCQNTAGRLIPGWCELVLSHLDQFIYHVKSLMCSLVNIGHGQQWTNSNKAFEKLSLPDWLFKELSRIIEEFGLPEKSEYMKIIEDVEQLTLGSSKNIRDMLFPQFDQISQLSRATISLENQTLREQLMNKFKSELVSVIKNNSVMNVLNHILTVWRPALNNHISKSLTGKFYLSTRGVTCLSELVSLTSASSSGLTHQLTQPLDSLLELPGEWSNFTGRSPLINIASNGPLHSPVTTNSNGLFVADICPVGFNGICETLPGSSLTSHVRRIYIRASNGRLVPYDINCTQRDFNESCPSLEDATPDKGSFFALNRIIKTDHFVQLVNDLLSREHSSAKRRVILSKPAIQQVGPHGICLTKTSFGTTSATTAFALSSGSLPVAGHALTPACSAWLSQPSATTSITIPYLDFENLLNLDKDQNNKATSNLNPSGSLIGGSTAFLLDALGKPSGFENGCYSTTSSLFSIVQNCIESYKTSRPDLYSISFNHFRDFLAAYGSEAELLEAFDNTINLIPSRPEVVSPSIKTLHSLVDGANYELVNDGSLVSSDLLRNWLITRLEDCESYWLFRRGVASHLAVNLLISQIVCNQTIPTPSQTIINIRNGTLQHSGTVFLGPGSGDSPTTFSSPAYAQLYANVMGYEQWIPGSREEPLLLEETLDSFVKVQEIDDVMRCGKLFPNPQRNLQVSPNLAGLFSAWPLETSPLCSVMETTLLSLQHRKHQLSTYQRAIARDDLILTHKSRKSFIHNLDASSVLLEMSNEQLIRLTLFRLESTNLGNTTNSLIATETLSAGNLSPDSATLHLLSNANVPQLLRQNNSKNKLASCLPNQMTWI